MTDINILEGKLKSNKLDAIYLFYGEERYLLENSLKKIERLFGEKINGINYIQIDNTNVANIISDIETPAFGYEKKLIIVKGSQLFKKKAKSKKNDEKNNESDYEKTDNSQVNLLANKIANYINENIKMIKESVVIIFVEDEADKNELYKVIDENGIVCEFNKLKELEISKRLKAICNAYKVNIDDATLRYFIDVCGTNMQDLLNEIRKQIEFAGENGNITKQSIDKLAIKQLDSVIFDLTDNLGKKNITEAMSVLSNMIYAREPIQKILIMLYNHFKKVYITKIAIKENRNIAESLNLKPNQTFLTTKYSAQSKYFTEIELKNILKDLTELDFKSKTGMIDANVGLEAILCQYCSWNIIRTK